MLFRSKVARQRIHRQQFQVVLHALPGGKEQILQHFAHGDETDVFADAGYVGVAKRKENQDRKVNWHVAMRPGKRRTLPETSLGKALEALEHTKARIRAKVEQPFHVVKNLFQHRKTRYRGMAKNAAQLLTLFGLANLMLAKRRLMAFHAQGAS